MSTDPRPGYSPDPREVPGFEQAWALGLLPRVPDAPPVAVTVNSERVRLCFVAATFVYLFVAINLANLFDWDGPAAGGAVVLGAAVLFYAGLRVPVEVAMKEYAAGYCRRDSRIGIHVLDRRRHYQNGAGPAGARWDLRGLWRLDAKNRPARPPVPEVLPVGWYPSPNEPGKYELWTGAAWMYHYRDPAVVPPNRS